MNIEEFKKRGIRYRYVCSHCGKTAFYLQKAFQKGIELTTLDAYNEDLKHPSHAPIQCITCNQALNTLYSDNIRVIPETADSSQLRIQAMLDEIARKRQVLHNIITDFTKIQEKITNIQNKLTKIH